MADLVFPDRSVTACHATVTHL